MLVHEYQNRYHVILLCWKPNQVSTIHSHLQSDCYIKILRGDFKEEIYENPFNGYFPSRNLSFDLNSKSALFYHTDDVLFVNDKIGLHRVTNLSETPHSVSLHLYIPPFTRSDIFDESTSSFKETEIAWEEVKEEPDK
ncbi:Cysteine dioxygenase [Thelohanellus kitauei]|uniref:Cysteine dioxygenase n=1 Tax=Thelohanellus kitauei TaxID=669202 RepID=A0A0C2MYF1_THEKT|nr:Cysteine dioxygenase [Thelohanellus kitauei]